MTNANHDLPLIFNVNFTSSSAHHNVTAHAGVPVWPGLNMSNWFVDDPSTGAGNRAYVNNAAIHEFGHMIGNPDEYQLSQAHYTATVGTNPTTDPERHRDSGHGRDQQLYQHQQRDGRDAARHQPAGSRADPACPVHAELAQHPSQSRRTGVHAGHRCSRSQARLLRRSQKEPTVPRFAIAYSPRVARPGPTPG